MLKLINCAILGIYFIFSGILIQSILANPTVRRKIFHKRLIRDQNEGQNWDADSFQIMGT